MPLSRTQLLEYAQQYDKDHPWWTSEEKRIGDQLRKDQEFGMDTLKEIVHWKFKTLPGREKIVNNLLKQHTDTEVRELTNRILPMTTKYDSDRITWLCKLKGVGPALASTILTFYNPADYCVYDIHVMREIYGEEPKYMFTGNKHYLKLLDYLRLESKRLDLPVRTIEKALFKKNLG